MMVDSKNFAHHVCTEAIARLIENGADHFFIAPGSRSSPIVSAIVRNPCAKKFLGIDERSLGFMALGYGKRAQKAGVVVVTSGTAVSNLYPAVTEAFMSSVPLLIITADRPFELRDCGANQTIFQTNIFANHIVKSFDLAPPTSLISLDAMISIFEHSLRCTNGLRKGPVHINWQLREPLANLPHDGEPNFTTSQARSRALGAHPPISRDVSDELVDKCRGKGLIVVGELLPQRGQAQILALAKKLSWPIFADVASNLRFKDADDVVAHYDLKLLNADFVHSLENVATVLKFGSRIVSKRLWQWILARPSSTSLVSLDDNAERIDQTGLFEHVFVGDLPSFLSQLVSKVTPAIATTAMIDTSQIENAVRQMLEVSADNEAFFAARCVAQIPQPANLFLSSGMPIRDVDQFASKTKTAVDVFVNRGASGIDGIVSTAAGVAAADKRPTVVLLGDVAFLHDTNGLMLLDAPSAPILVIVINNGGGGIFHFLPIAQERDVITPFLDTPHNVHVASLCRAHNIAHVSVAHVSEFDDVMSRFFRDGGVMVMEVHIKKETNVLLHQNFYKKISQLRLS